jgi:hypothetical protein
LVHPSESSDWLIADAISRACTIAEEFVELRFRSGEAHFLAAGGTPAQWRTHVANVEGSWVRRRDAWVAAFGVRFIDSPDHAPLMGYVQARNAFTHGMGKLTDFQVSIGQTVLDDLAAAGIALSDRSVLPTELSVVWCTHTARDFALFVDLSAPF